MNNDIKSMVASTDSIGIIGNLTWYTIQLTGIKADELSYLLNQHGLDKYMLKPRNPADTARCAMSDSEVSKSVDGGDLTNRLFFKEVWSDKTEVVWKLVAEQVDRKGKKLKYDENVGTVRFDKATELPEIQMCSTYEAREQILKAFDLYRDYKVIYTSRHIRELVAKILGDMSPIPVRPSGGVYFVPASQESGLTNLVSLINKFGDSESYMIPLINTPKNKDMVRQKLEDHIRNTIKEAAGVLKAEEVTKGVASLRLAEVKKVIEDFKGYKSELSFSMENMDEMIDLLKKQAEALIEKVTA